MMDATMVGARPPSVGPEQNSLTDIFTSFAGILMSIAFVALIIAIIIVGFKIMFAIRSGDSVREAIANMGLVAVAALVVAGASGIASALVAVGQTIGKSGS